jgi:hypothetical protein
MHNGISVRRVSPLNIIVKNEYRACAGVFLFCAEKTGMLRLEGEVAGFVFAGANREYMGAGGVHGGMSCGMRDSGK